MKLLVTGALGHIGSKLIRSYAKRPDIDLIRIIDNLSTQRYCSLFNLDGNYEFIEGDILNDDDLRKSLDGIDTVIHLAAITDAPSTINQPELTKKVNFLGTQRVLNAAVQAGVKKFLFPSTTSVYGETEGLVDESFLDYKPCTPYAESKLESERFLQEAGKNGKIRTNILRMGTIFGTSVGMRFHTAVNKFAYLACLNRPITIWEDAFNQKRPYLGLDDCINAFELVEKKGVSGELYNVLTGNYTPIDIVDILKEFRPNLKIQFTKSPIINQKSYEVSNNKIKYLGFVSRDNLRDELRQYMKIFDSIRNEGIGK